MNGLDMVEIRLRQGPDRVKRAMKVMAAEIGIPVNSLIINILMQAADKRSMLSRK